MRISRRILAALLALCCLLTATAAAAASAPSADESVLSLWLAVDSEGEQSIRGLTVQKAPIRATNLVGLLVECTADDATFIFPEGSDQAPAGDTAAAGTGLHATWTTDDGPVTAPLIVSGDVLGTGVIGITQLVRMAQGLNGTNPLTGYWLEAADFDGNGFQLTDLVMEANLLSSGPSVSSEQSQEIIDAAVAVQTDGDVYKADSYHVVALHEGDIIYGMLPGQSSFYTDASTVNACDESYIAMYQRLQMLPHPEYGYREELGVYRVTRDMLVACGYCLANAEIDGELAGPGGGVQFVIPSYEDVVELIETLELHA